MSVTRSMMGSMSAMEEQGAIPEWTLGWRLARALGYAGVSVEEMAEELGVSRSTVSRWMNDRGAPPRVGYVKLWCQRTGTNLEWVVDRQLVLTGSTRSEEQKSELQSTVHFLCHLFIN